MFDIGWSEMAVIALVALVVLGPKELPQAMKTFAAFTRKMQRYARDFRSGVDGIIREAELEDAKKALDAVRANPKAMLKNVVDPTGEASAAVAEVESAAKDKGTTTPSPTPSSPALAPPSAAAAVTAAVPVPAPAPEQAPQELSKVIVQPTNMAPPHSVRPPAPKAPAATQTADAPAPAKPGASGGDDA